MRDKKECTPKLTSHPNFGDIVIKTRCKSNGIMHVKDYEKVLNYFLIISFIGESSSDIGNIVATSNNFEKDAVFTPNMYDTLKKSFTIKNIIGNVETPENGNLLAHNTLLDISGVFTFEDFKGIDSSWIIEGIEGVNVHSKLEAVVGDILVLAYDTILIIDPDDFSKISSNWNAIGIVAIESRNTPDSTLRILSLDYMDYGNPTVGNSGTGVLMCWGASGDINGVSNRNQVPCMSNSNDKTLTENINRAIDYAFIPTDYFTGTQSATDGYKYLPNIETTTSYQGRYCPPAYLNDGNLNPQYTATSAIIPGTTTQFTVNNAFSDFNGLENTQNIMKNCNVSTPTNSADPGNYPAALCCHLYNKGNLEWYLPACGELGLIVSNFNTLNSSRTKVGYNSYSYSSYWYWSSTPYSSSFARRVYGNIGYCRSSSRSEAGTSGRVLACAAF